MSNTAELPIPMERQRRLVARCADATGGTVVATADGHEIHVAVRTDLAAARRVAGAFRRVDRVEIVVSGSGSVDAAVHAVGHRLPVRRMVSAGAALGLARLGVPALVETRAEGRS